MYLLYNRKNMTYGLQQRLRRYEVLYVSKFKNIFFRIQGSIPTGNIQTLSPLELYKRRVESSSAEKTDKNKPGNVSLAKCVKKTNEILLNILVFV
jgi:hypothetical protein